MALTDESVVFVFLKDSRVLVEARRQKNGSVIWCFPGGAIEETDAIDADDYVIHALEREVQEETGITVFEPDHLRSAPIGNIESVYHFFIIREWSGAIPGRVMDTKHLLKWVEIDEYKETVVPPVFRDFAESIAALT